MNFSIIDFIDIFAFIIAIVFFTIFTFVVSKNTSNRAKLERKLNSFMRHKQIKNRLVNSNCELRIWDRNAGFQNYTNLVLCCREKSDGKKLGKIFFLTGNSDHVATTWALFCMKFNTSSTYKSMKSVYKLINNRGLRFAQGSTYRVRFEQDDNAGINLNENRNEYEKILPLNITENEYCRMEIRTSSGNNFIIVCTNIWDNSLNPEQFFIAGTPEYLYEIFGEFKSKKNQFMTFYSLKRKYKNTMSEQTFTRIKPEEIEQTYNEELIEPDDIDNVIDLEVSKTDERKLDL